MTPDPHADTADQPVHRLEQQRRDNRDAIAALGINPYGGRADGVITLADARARYDPHADQAHQQSDSGEDERPVVRVAGRIVLKRDGGKLIWMQLRDQTTAPASDLADEHDKPTPLADAGVVPDLQIAVSKKDCAAPGFDAAKNLDLGDLVVVEGPLMKTRKGEVTVWASALDVAAKSLQPPPEKWSGLQDVELRYRRRYVDLYANPATMRAFELRSHLVSFIRRWLHERGYLEVETPMLQLQAGGAAARPFITHMNALDISLYMRVAPELYLKRLLVGGMRRVFEINRNFRNEGLDKQHNPEFTMIELYDALGDVHRVTDLTESLIRDAAEHAAQHQGLDHAAMPFGEIAINFREPFERITYADLFERALGFPMTDASRVRAEAERRGLTAKWAAHLEAEGRSAEDIDPVLLANELFEEVAEPSLDPARPTFITHYPAALSPLTRPNPDDPDLADRADLFIAGMEIGPHYTELNDPDVQAEKFRQQLAGVDDEEQTFRTFDDDFVRALKVGMPPAGGMGLGIDRLMMLLLNQPTIRDVVLFPMMRPEA